MPKPRSDTGNKNLISANLIRLRKDRKVSQRDLAKLMQLAGCDMDRNVITRIETQKRYVTDIEIKKLCQVLDTTFDELTRETGLEEYLPVTGRKSRRSRKEIDGLYFASKARMGSWVLLYIKAGPALQK